MGINEQETRYHLVDPILKKRGMTILNA